MSQILTHNRLEIEDAHNYQHIEYASLPIYTETLYCASQLRSLVSVRAYVSEVVGLGTATVAAA
jgi:hypothetical protein